MAQDLQVENLVVNQSINAACGSGFFRTVCVGGKVNASKYMTASGTVETPIGTVLLSLLTPSQMKNVAVGYVLADGQLIKGTPYHHLTGSSRVPDMRGMFARGSKNPQTVGASFSDSTAIPNNGFVTSVSGEHTHLIITNKPYTEEGNVNVYLRENTGPPYATVTSIPDMPSTTITATNSAGLHAHFIEGGDDETAPQHVTLNYYVFVGKKQN